MIAHEQESHFFPEVVAVLGFWVGWVGLGWGFWGGGGVQVLVGLFGIFFGPKFMKSYLEPVTEVF